MNNEFEFKEVDLGSIDLRARQLRAEAFASGVKAMRNWIVTSFTLRGFGNRRSA